MMKKLLSILLAAIMLLTCIPALAEEMESICDYTFRTPEALYQFLFA